MTRKYTLENPQTLSEFKEKYKNALDKDGKFIPGKANLNYDDMKAEHVYELMIGGSPLYDSNGTEVGKQPPAAEVNADWIEDTRGKGWIAQHPKGAAMIGAAAALVGGGALLGAGGTGGAAATGAAAGTTSASGLAGTLGMNAGMGATALNAGALNAGITLARGGNIGDALKSGVTAAALSGVGGWAKEAIGGATVELGKGISSAVSNVGAGALTGAVGAAVTGRDWKEGLTTGAISGGINAVSSAVGGWAKDSTTELGKAGSNFVGNAAATAANTVLRGGDIGTAAQNVAINAAGGYAGMTAKEQTGSDFAGQAASTLASTALRGGDFGNATKNLAINYGLNTGGALIDNFLDDKPNAVFKNAGVKDPSVRAGY